MHACTEQKKKGGWWEEEAIALSHACRPIKPRAFCMLAPMYAYACQRVAVPVPAFSRAQWMASGSDTVASIIPAVRSPHVTVRLCLCLCARRGSEEYYVPSSIASRVGPPTLYELAWHCNLPTLVCPAGSWVCTVQWFCLRRFTTLRRYYRCCGTL